MLFIRLICKKLLPISLMIFLCCEAFSSQDKEHQAAFSNDIQAAYDTVDENISPILRLHVVANSNSEEDQRIKLIVKDALVKKFSPSSSLISAEELVVTQGYEILNTVNEALKKEGNPYGAQLRFGIMPFPEKTYGSIHYPAGDYEALRVDLGEAKGENWWCVLFPPLCIVETATLPLPDTDELIFESDIHDLIISLKNKEANANKGQ